MPSAAYLRVDVNSIPSLRKPIAPALFILMATVGFAADLQLKISDEIVPPGGTATIKITAVHPLPIGSGRLVVDLDPTIFGSVDGVTVLSVNGDGVGAAGVYGRRLEVTFQSDLGGLGRSPGLPIVQISVLVMAGAPVGARVAVTALAENAVARRPGQGANEAGYSVSIIPGSVTVGAAPSVRNVSPSGG